MGSTDRVAPVGAEQRTAPRRPVLYRLDVTNGSNTHIGYMADIAMGGMRVRCKPGIDAAKLGKIRIEFPKWMDLGQGITMTGRFVWSKPVEDGGTEGGFVFSKVSDQAEATLDALIEKVAQAAVEDGHL